MRGQKVRINENGDGEVDEHFWAQAAADQAAGRGDEDNDEGKYWFGHVLVVVNCLDSHGCRHPLQYPILPR